MCIHIYIYIYLHIIIPAPDYVARAAVGRHPAPPPCRMAAAAPGARQAPAPAGAGAAPQGQCLSRYQSECSGFQCEFQDSQAHSVFQHFKVIAFSLKLPLSTAT